MPIGSAGGYLNDPSFSAADKSYFSTLENSNSDTGSATDQQAIQGLIHSNDSIARDLGQALLSAPSYTALNQDGTFTQGTYSAQAVHDLLYAIDHDSSVPKDNTSATGGLQALQDAIGDSQSDPNLSGSDKQNLENWIKEETTPSQSGGGQQLT